MRRIVFITQQVDRGHPALGATVAKLEALAERLDEVVVLADGAVPGALPTNCRVHAFAARTKVERGLRFERALARELGRPRPLAVVAHMCPIYAVLAAPLARPLGVPVLLWYTHWHASRTLGLAERLSTTVVSVDRRSFPRPSEKVRAIGHGIDLEEFPCRAHEERPGDSVRVLALGRTSPAKGLPAIVRAVRLVADRGVDVQLDAYGPSLSELERRHRLELERLVEELEVTDRVRLRDAVPRGRVPQLLAGTDVLVNNMRAGAPDKAVYEAAASCVPVAASNPVFDTLLDERWRFAQDDAEGLAGRLVDFAALSNDERRRIGEELRTRVAERHSVEHWADALLAAAENG